VLDGKNVKMEISASGHRGRFSLVGAEPHWQAKTGSVFGLCVLALCWGLAFDALRVDWAINPQYHYGWFVPLLALGLFRFRWSSRPSPDPPRFLRTTVIIAGVAMAALLPIRLIEEANPEWRLVQWTHALQMVLVTLCLLQYAGGWSWVRHFGFTVCFLLVAVPWPVPLEQMFVQNLMQAVAGITVEAVGLLNIPAVQHGNVIQISSGLVGVDEACSGVRSLQTAFFICLFLGELYRFSLLRRFSLLLLSFLAAIICNLARTFFLVWSASRHGLDRMHSLHDTVGQVVLVATLVAIWILAHLLRRPQLPGPAVSADPAPKARFLPTRVTFGVLTWVLLVEITTEVWFRAHESKIIENAHWSVNWPDAQMKAETVPIDDTVQSVLRYSEGKAGQWQDSSGNRWQAFFFRWAPGRNSAQLASAHTPDICLRGVGYQLTRDLGNRMLSTKDVSLPFRQYVFSRGLIPLHVFYCRWEGQVRTGAADLGEDGTKMSRIRAVIAGRRHLGQQVLEVAINGPDSPEVAWEVVERELPRIIRR
jgi:exosortase